MLPRIDHSQLIALRASRQHLAPVARGRSREDVLTILKDLQPYPPLTGAIPGAPPSPVSRVTGDGEDWAQQWRAAGRVLKGRFMKGNIAYVSLEDLDLYAAAFRASLPALIPQAAQRILDVLKQNEALPRSTLRTLCDLDRNRFDRALSLLSSAFEVMEIQKEIDWDSPWDLRQRAYPQADPDQWDRREAQGEVLCRFTQAFGPATLIQIVDWSGWSQKTVRSLVDDLLRWRKLSAVAVDGQEEPAYLAAESAGMLESIEPLPPFIAILPANDPLVLPQWSLVEALYRPYRLPYCYGIVLVDGELCGAAWGPYHRAFIDIQDLSLARALVDDVARMDEVLAALEAYIGGGQVPIHIAGINGQAEAPWIREIFERNGYAWQSGYFLKD